MKIDNLDDPIAETRRLPELGRDDKKEQLSPLGLFKRWSFLYLESLNEMFY